VMKDEDKEQVQSIHHERRVAGGYER